MACTIAGHTPNWPALSLQSGFPAGACRDGDEEFLPPEGEEEDRVNAFAAAIATWRRGLF